MTPPWCRGRLSKHDQPHPKNTRAAAARQRPVAWRRRPLTMEVCPVLPGGRASMSADPATAVRRLADAYRAMTQQIGKVIVGQHQVIEQLLLALFSRGHCLLVGVPGLAKT